MKKIITILTLTLAFAIETFAQVPTITSFAPSSGVVGSTVVLTGTNFNIIANNNTVYFGAAKASVVASTATSCTVTVPSDASFGPITLTRNSGMMAYSTVFFNPTQNCPDDITTASFDTTSFVSLNLQPYYVNYGDVDLDGKIDMIVTEKATSVTSYITIYRNTSVSAGAITFAPGYSIAIGDNGRNTALGDLNGDGKLDIACLNRADGKVGVIINTSTTGNVSFNAPVNYLVSYGSGGEGIAISDLNKDGKPDIAVATGHGTVTDSIAVLQNQYVTMGAAFNSGSFMHYTSYHSGNNVNGLGIADLDGDTFDDVVSSNNGSNNLSIFLNTSTIGGAITFANRQTLTSGSAPFNLSLGDVNADGKIDIAVGINGTSGFRVYENNSTIGNVNFNSNAILSSSINGSRDADIADMNGDGKLDVVASCTTANLLVVVLNNKQTGSIGAANYFAVADTFYLPAGNNPRDVSVADLNADGKMDMVSTSTVSDRITIFRSLVNGGPFMTSASSATICSGSPVGITFSATPASSPVTYLWKTVATPSVAGESTTNQTASSITNTLSTIAGVTTDQILTYTVTPSSSLCPTGVSHPQLVNVTVSPKPIISNTTAITCSGDGFTVTPSGTTMPAGTTYSWLAPVVTGSMTGGAAGSGTVITGVLTNTTTINRTATYTVTPTSGSCSGATFILTVTVSPKPIIGATTSTVCSGATFTAALSGVIPAGTTYSWAAPAVTGSMTGGASVASSTNVTGSLTNTTSTNQTATYTITPTSGVCTGSSFTYTVTVKPMPNITAINFPLTICTGTSFSLMPTGTLPVGTTYSWALPTVTGGMTGGAVGTNAATIVGALTNTTATNQNATYTITPTANACVGAPFSVVVPINPKPVIAATTATVCTGTTFIANPSGTIPAGTTYSWPLPTATGITGGAVGTGTTTITGTLFNSNAIFKTAIYTITPMAGACSGPVFNVTITVNPKATIAPVSTTICTGNAITATITGTIPAGTTYSWPLPLVTGGVTGGTSASGATTLADVLTNTTSTSQTATYSVTPLSGSCAGSTFTVTVNVNPKPTIAAASSTVCSGASFTANPSGTIPVGTTYSWSLPSVTGGMTGAVTGTNTSAIIGTLTNTTSTSQSASYIISPSAGSCLGSTFVYSVTVNPKALIAASTATVCSGITYTFIPSGTIPVGTTYSWALPTVTGGMTGASTGSNASIIAGSLTNSTAISQTAIYTITPTSGSCSGLPFTLTVTVNPKPFIAATSATVCTGITFTASPSGTIPVGTTYSWPLPTATGMTGGATGTNASLITGLLTNTATTAKIATYTITPTAGSCVGSTFNVSVTVNPKPTLSATASKTICSGNSVALTYTNSVPSNYSWVATNNLYTTGESTVNVNSATINDVLLTTNAATQTVVYKVVATSAAGGCVSNTQTLSVKVDYIPNANAGPDQNVVCTSAAFLNANQVASPNSGAWSLVPGPSPPSFVNAYNTSVSPLNGSPSATTYYMVWTITNGAAFCPAKRDTVKLIADFNNGLCAPGADYHYSSGTNSGIFTSGSENICVNTVINFTDASQSANTWDWDFDYTGTFGSNSSLQNPTYTYTSSGTYVCRLKIHSNTTGLDYTKDYTITVIGAPTAPTSISGTTSGICAGNTQLGYSTPLITNATIYNWTLPSGSSIVSNAGDYSLINVLYSSSAVDGTMTVNAANGCGTSANYNQLVSISEVPSAAGLISEINNNTTFCQGANNITFTVPVIADASSYVWNLPNGVGASSPITTTTNSITVNISPTALSGSITVYGVNTCSITGASSVLSITVNPSPEDVYSIAGASNVCTGISTLYNASSPLGTGVVWSFLPLGSASTSDNTTIANITFNTIGTTTVTAAHQNSCGFGVSASYTVLVNSLPVAAGPISGSTSVCENQSGVTFSVPAISNATDYIWTTPVGAITTSGFNTNNITTNWTNTGGLISVYAVNGCGNGNASVNYSVVVNPLPLVTASASNSVTCLGGNITLSGGGAQTYTWTPATVVNNTAFTPSVSSSYTVTGEDVNGCKNTETVSVAVIAPLTPSICMVTVDSMSINNVIYWDNTGFTPSDSFYVYRDIANNNYALIGKQPSSSVMFIDTVRTLYTANGDPNASSWRYKIAIKDSCGNIGQLSPFHQTIFFQNNSGNFNWSPYQIEGQALPIPALNNYLFNRDDLSTNVWNTIQTLSASSILYTDVNYALYSSGRWRVETQWNIVCGGVAQKVNSVNRSKSNVKDNFEVTTSLKTISVNDFAMMPNPANDYVEISLKKNTTNTVVEIIDVVGRVVVSKNVDNNENVISINTSHLANGIYTVRLMCNEGNVFKKLVVER